MDFSAALKQEIFRPGVTLIIPGIVAAFPFSFITVYYFPELWPAVQASPVLWAFLGVVVSLAFGLVMQDLGAQFEVQVIDRYFDIKTKKKHTTDWYRYLRCAFVVEPIGQRYIHNTVLILMFELNTAFALIVCWAGLAWLYAITPAFALGTFRLTTVAFVVAILYLLVESFFTAASLAKVRKELVTGTLKR